MKLKLLVAGCILMSSSLVMGQTVSYEIEKNDPNDFDKLHVYLDPIYADIMGYKVNNDGMFAMSLGLGASGHYFIGSKLNLSARFNYKYYSIGAEENGSGFFTEIGGQYNFTSGSKTGIARIKVGKNSTIKDGYETTTTKSIDVSGIETNTFLAGRAGITIEKTHANGFKDGVSEQNNYDANLLNSGGYLGVSFQSIRNVLVNVEGYGKRSGSYIRDFYADVLFQSYKAEQVLETGKRIDFSDSKYQKESQFGLGFRVGYTNHANPKGHATNYKINGGKGLFGGTYQKIELGSLPGGTFYFRFSYGVKIVSK